MIATGFIIKCDVCGRITDDYSDTEDEAIYYQSSKGWGFIKAEGDDDMFCSCPDCNKEPK